MKKIIFILFLGCVLGGAYFAVNGGSQNFNKVDWEKVSVGELRIMILMGADVNARNTTGATPLMLAAARNRNPAVVEALINAGADVNAQDRSGRTPLIWARKFNSNGAVAEVLMKAMEESSAGYAGN